MNIGIMITFTISANVCYKQYTHIQSIAEIPKNTHVSRDINNTTDHISQKGDYKEPDPIQDILAEKSRSAARNINAGMVLFVDI